MSPDENDSRIAASGRWGTIEWASDARGRMPAYEFYSGLAEKDQAKAMALLQRMAEVGLIKGQDKFKKLGTFSGHDLYEFKSFQTRLIGEFRRGGRFVIGFGVTKKQDKHRPRDLELAAQVLEEDGARESE